MSTVTYSLGELEHVYARRHLKLNTQADITLSSLDASHSSFSPLSPDLEDLVSNRTWVSSGNSFEINLALSFHGVEVDDGSISDHIENLGLVLRNAEVLLDPSMLR